MKPNPPINPTTKKPAAFTLVELLVIISVVALLSSLLLPALAGTKSNSKMFHCENNLRQMAKAFILYAADNNDRIVPYQTGGGFWGAPASPFGAALTAPQALAIIQGRLRTNNLLYSYAPNPAVFHCPADTRMKLRPGSGWAYDSYSKTQNVGGDNYWGATYTNLTAIQTPSETFCFIEDADERGYNLGTWVVQWNAGSRNFQWVDPPALFHGSAASVALTDGSVQTHQWQNPALVNAGLAAARGQRPDVAAAPLSGADYEFVRNGYRFPGWK